MADTRGHVLIVGAFRFPTGDAAAARVLGIAKSLRLAGCKVTFGGWEQRERPEDADGNGGFAYEGFPYVSQDEFRTSRMSAAGRLWRYVFAGGATLRWIGGMPRGSVRAVIAYHGGSLFLLRLLVLCASVESGSSPTAPNGMLRKGSSAAAMALVISTTSSECGSSIR